MKRKKPAPAGELSYTQRLKLERREREFWYKYFQAPEDLADLPTHVNWVKLSFTDVDDEGLQFLVGRIKAINMLDLKDTNITAEGIRHLTKLESVRELRLKECRELDDSCMPYICQLTSLILLQINCTGITEEGLRHIGALKNLQTLFLSLDTERENVRATLYEIKRQLPSCDIVVNGKDFE